MGFSKENFYCELQPLTSTLLSLFSSSCEPPKKLEILLPISDGEKKFSLETAKNFLLVDEIEDINCMITLYYLGT